MDEAAAQEEKTIAWTIEKCYTIYFKYVKHYFKTLNSRLTIE